MMNLNRCVLALMLTGIALAGLGATPADAAWNRLMTGWCTGTENGLPDAGTFLLAALKRWELTRDKAVLDDARRAFWEMVRQGDLTLKSSRIPCTPDVYALWKTLRARAFGEAEKAAAIRLLREIATSVERKVSKESLNGTGEHGILRLPMIYAAAWDATGDFHWRDLELKYLDDGCKKALEGSLPESEGVVAVFPAQLSHRLLFDCEADPVRRARILAVLKRFGDSVIPEVRREIPAHMLNVLLVPFGEPPAESRAIFDEMLRTVDFSRVASAGFLSCALMAYWYDKDRESVCENVSRQVSLRPPQWISGESLAPESAAPVLTASFVAAEIGGRTTLDLAVAGWCEVRLNGTKVGREVLAPVTAQPDRRLSRLKWDLTPSVRPGTNVIEVVLGNGWWNSFTKCGWGFEKAPWVSAPKICGALRVDGKPILVTDDSWQVYDSPIVFNALRNGEWYDARREGRRPWLRPAAIEKYAPSGAVSDEDATPCRVCATLNPVRTLTAPDGATIYDFGANIAGWCAIEAEGPSGAKVTLDYDESLAPSNTLLGHVSIYIRRQGEPRPVQHDEYTLAGRAGGEAWEPRFTYHGFRYAKVTLTGGARLKAIRARFVHSDFASVGSFSISDPTFAALQDATRRSYLSNFVGIPTDCPHREKNGWTGDAQLAMETGLWNFDARSGYVHFLRMVMDAQRPNGAIPCILPHSPSFGFFWGSGPAWDNVLFEIPRQLFRFYGDEAPARDAYGAMQRYLAFIRQKADADGLTAYGLGDWCCPVRKLMTPVRLTDSAYVYHFNRELAFWARRFGEEAVATECDRAAECLAAAFNRAFYHGDGHYASDELTALAAPLYFKGLCAPGEESKVVARLVEKARALKHKADFGILGAKWVPRVLAENGHVDDAWAFFTQKEQPGWAHWLQFGDGTLREMWDDTASHNHIMFGDLSAWAYEYLGGIKIVEPGFRKVKIAPVFPKALDRFSVTHQTPYGEIRVSWHREGGKPILTTSVPKGVSVVH